MTMPCGKSKPCAGACACRVEQPQAPAMEQQSLFGLAANEALHGGDDGQAVAKKASRSRKRKRPPDINMDSGEGGPRHEEGRFKVPPKRHDNPCEKRLRMHPRYRCSKEKGHAGLCAMFPCEERQDG